MCHHLNPGARNAPVINSQVHVGKIISAEKGLKALKVECADCNKPAIWELKAFGPVIFGVQEVKPVCVNKPDEPDYNSSIKFSETWEANEPFRQAKEKQTLWNGSLSSNFFEVFGEPQSVSAEGENSIILVYPHGTKTVGNYSAFLSEHWKTSPTNKWEQEGKSVNAEFIFDDIPKAKVLMPVANLYGHPTLSKVFDLLPANIQNEILSIVKNAVKPAEKIAEERIEEFLASDFEGENIHKTQKNIVNLQAPGEMLTESGSRQTQQQIMGHYGGESWGTGHYSNVNKVSWYLRTGATKIARTGLHAGEYIDGFTFSINEPQKDDTPEQIRDRLLINEKKNLQESFERAKKTDPIPADPRIYDLSPEEWTERYNKSWDVRQQRVEQQWHEEGETSLNQMKAELESYEHVNAKQQKLREEADEVTKRSKKLRINLGDLENPALYGTNTESLESLQENIISVQLYINTVNALIEEQLRKRGEVEIAATKSEEEKERALKEAMEAPATPAPWYLSGIDPAELEKYGRKQGEGFGSKVAGKSLYLPGDRALVGIKFHGGTRRYKTRIEDRGLYPLGDSLPTYVGKRDEDLLAFVENPDWNIKWVHYHDDEPSGYGLANAKGKATLTPSFNNSYQYQSNSWDQTTDEFGKSDGQGPTAEEIISAHNLVIPPDQQESISVPQNSDDDVVGNVGYSTEIEEIQKQVTFTDSGKRHFKCSCGCMERVTKTDYDKYQQGEELKITCVGCKGHGSIKKS